MALRTHLSLPDLIICQPKLSIIQHSKTSAGFTPLSLKHKLTEVDKIKTSSMSSLSLAPRFVMPWDIKRDAPVEFIDATLLIVVIDKRRGSAWTYDHSYYPCYQDLTQRSDYSISRRIGGAPSEGSLLYRSTITIALGAMSEANRAYELDQQVRYVPRFVPLQGQATPCCIIWKRPSAKRVLYASTSAVDVTGGDGFRAVPWSTTAASNCTVYGYRRLNPVGKAAIKLSLFQATWWPASRDKQVVRYFSIKKSTLTVYYYYWREDDTEFTP